MIKIDDHDFIRLTEYLRENFGINLEKKRVLVESRLNNHLVKLGFNAYSDYIDYAINDASGEEISQIVNILTTNFTYFMREWDHFNYLKSVVLPELKANNKSHDLRTWSAGCSAGQEAYTLSMVISDFLGNEKSLWDAKVLGTDISIKALNTAKAGIYDDEALSNMPPAWKLNYFDKLDMNKWQANKALQNELVFRRFNLMDEVFPFKKKFHIIFCRNVMIYFNEETKKKLIKKFYDALDDGGYLFIGQSESLNRNETAFKYMRPSIFKKGE